MSWFKVDDGFGSGPKVMMIPRSERMACIGAWLLAGTWSAQHLTDGHVPDYMLDELGVDMSQRDRLGTVGLWRETGDGIVFNDWSDYQPTRADVLAKREAERQRKEEYRRKQAEKSRQSPAGTNADADAGQERASGPPDPTRPDPTPTTSNEVEGARKRAARIPDEFIVTPAMRAWAAREVPALDVNASTRKFVDYWRAESGAKARKLDWVAAWRNWMRRDDENQSKRLTPTQRAAQTAAAGRNVAGMTITTLELGA